MPAYSFKDVSVVIDGPGIQAIISGVAEEGVKLAPVGDKNEMVEGADGEIMHSLIAAETSIVTLSLLKTSPLNGVLQSAYNFQTSSSSVHGRNVITIRDPFRGDLHVASQAAFKKRPDIDYAKSGGKVEWTFDCGRTTSTLGIGTPEL